MNEASWWAEDAEHPNDARWPWVPTLDTDGMCLSLPISFATEAECREWIAEHVIGVELERSSPPAVAVAMQDKAATEGEGSQLWHEAFHHRGAWADCWSGKCKRYRDAHLTK